MHAKTQTPNTLEIKVPLCLSSCSILLFSNHKAQPLHFGVQTAIWWCMGIHSATRHFRTRRIASPGHPSHSIFGNYVRTEFLDWFARGSLFMIYLIQVPTGPPFVLFSIFPSFFVINQGGSRAGSDPASFGKSNYSPFPAVVVMVMAVVVAVFNCAFYSHSDRHLHRRLLMPLLVKIRSMD